MPLSVECDSIGRTRAAGKGRPPFLRVVGHAALVRFASLPSFCAVAKKRVDTHLTLNGYLDEVRPWPCLIAAGILVEFHKPFVS